MLNIPHPLLFLGANKKYISCQRWLNFQNWLTVNFRTIFNETQNQSVFLSIKLQEQISTAY